VERLRHYALSHFSWDIVAERILSVYRGVLKGRSP
jgi:glycosyltransferase involved in cell wall biosynthesis